MRSYRSTAAIAVIVFASAMVGIGIHHLLESGNCSSTGYTRYGPAPKCSSSDTDWGIVLPIATFLVIGAGVIGAPDVFVLLGPLFLAIGIGALTVSPLEAFDVVFGGCFAVAGAGLLAVPVWSAVRDRRGISRSRLAIGLAACVAALAIAFGVASLFPSEHPIGSAKASAAPPNPTGASFPQIASDDPASLYRTANFERMRTIAAAYVGSRARVRSIRLVPGGAHISLAIGDGRGRDISIDSTGGYLSADVKRLSGDPPTFALSGLDTSSPEKLATQVGGPVDHMTATPGGDGGIRWAAYPAGGGPVYPLTTRPPR